MTMRAGSRGRGPDSRRGAGGLSSGLKARWSAIGASWRRDPPPRTDSPASRGAFYPGLDSLRGLAAVAVMVYHVIEWFRWTSFPSGNPVALAFRLGGFGVDLFFVLSGFVITLSALNLLDRDPERYPVEFCRRRLARIVPLHYLTCLVFAVFVTPPVMFHPRFFAHALTHLTFTHSFFWQTMGSINGPNWSLSVEMQFYLMILLAAPLLRRVRPWTMLAACVAVAWSWRALMFARFGGEFRNGVNMTWFGVSQLPGTLDEFGMGVLLAMVLHRDRDGRLHRLLRRTRFLWPVAAYLIGLATMRLFWSDPGFWSNGKLVVFWKTMLGATFLLVVVSACAIDDRWFLRLTAPLRWLGTISYGIYLWHMLVVSSLMPLLTHEPLRACKWTLGLTLLLAALSWRLMEKPLLERFGRGRGDSRGEGPGDRSAAPPQARGGAAEASVVHQRT